MSDFFASIPQDELQRTDNLIQNHQTFRVIGVKNMSFIAKELEYKIESRGMKCRIYTSKRVASLALGLIPGVPLLASIGSAVGIAAHNIATFNPDYELIKHPVDNCIEVVFKK